MPIPPTCPAYHWQLREDLSGGFPWFPEKSEFTKNLRNLYNTRRLTSFKEHSPPHATQTCRQCHLVYAPRNIRRHFLPPRHAPAIPTPAPAGSRKFLPPTEPFSMANNPDLPATLVQARKLIRAGHPQMLLPSCRNCRIPRRKQKMHSHSSAPLNSSAKTSKPLDQLSKNSPNSTPPFPEDG
ncbi:MAG UNVERIFIED_CONTAM: hypothetical protein LVR18_20760 [Planctomycetaceae bacterium]